MSDSVSGFKDKVCKACGLCGGDRCFSFTEELKGSMALPETFPKSYNGLRFTSDAMDCAIPIAIDSHSGCSYSCLYCFANNLQRAPDRNAAMIKRAIREGSFYAEWDVTKLERFLDRSLKGHVYEAMYPLMDAGAPVQLGALGDPLDDLESVGGWLKDAIPLFIKYRVPVRVGTKGAAMMLKRETRKLFEKSPEQFWFAFSIISNSDELISKVDVGAPVTSERLEAMRVYSEMGASCSLRFRPFLPGISDAYEGEPEAWRVLMERCAAAGARAISFEYIFLNSAPTDRQKAMYRLMFRAQGNPKFGKEWHAMSQRRESCRRGTREYKFDQTIKIRDTAHKLGMVFGCSDPHFKELNDTGCCCGMTEDDPWFGGWSRRQMTEVVVQAKRAYDLGERRRYGYLDWGPRWAHDVCGFDLFSTGGWHNSRTMKNCSFGDHMRNKWNNPTHPRSPYVYFGGVLRPVGVDCSTEDVLYEYRDWSPGFKDKFIGESNT